MAAAEQAIFDQGFNGLADGDAGQAEIGGQLALAGQDGAALDLVRGNGLFKGGAQAPVQRSGGVGKGEALGEHGQDGIGLHWYPR